MTCSASEERAVSRSTFTALEEIGCANHFTCDSDIIEQQRTHVVVSEGYFSIGL